MPQRYTTYECPYLEPIIVYYSVSLLFSLFSPPTLYLLLCDIYLEAD